MPPTYASLFSTVSMLIGACACAPSAGAADPTAMPRSAWVAWTPIAPPDTDGEQLECVRQTTGSRVTLSRSADGRVSRVTTRAARVATLLPFEPQIPLPGARRSVRQVLSRPDGYLVTVDQGEWGGGLFWVPQASRDAEPIGTLGNDAIRWIAELGFGTLAVSGLCHGDACALSSRVSLIHRVAASQRWQLDTLRVRGVTMSKRQPTKRYARPVPSSGHDDGHELRSPANRRVVR